MAFVAQCIKSMFFHQPHVLEFLQFCYLLVLVDMTLYTLNFFCAAGSEVVSHLVVYTFFHGEREREGTLILYHIRLAQHYLCYCLCRTSLQLKDFVMLRLRYQVTICCLWSLQSSRGVEETLVVSQLVRRQSCSWRHSPLHSPVCLPPRLESEGTSILPYSYFLASSLAQWLRAFALQLVNFTTLARLSKLANNASTQMLVALDTSLSSILALSQLHHRAKFLKPYNHTLAYTPHKFPLRCVLYAHILFLTI